MKIDEARLTAFIMGEINDPDQYRVIEEALNRDPELQRQADEIRRLQDGLRAAFQNEAFVPVECPSFPLSLPGLKPDEDQPSTVNWMPWVSALAATVFLVTTLFILSNQSDRPNSNVLVHTPSGPTHGERAIEEFDLSLGEIDLLGPAATWSDSQVLANSIFYKNQAKRLIQPLATRNNPDQLEAIELMPDRGYSYAWQEPLSVIPVFYDGLGITKLELSLERGELPSPKEVEIEALVNAFSYGYDAPENPEEPFLVHMEQSESPWQPGQTLLRVGVQGYEVSSEDRADSNFVILVDVSGSMDEANKLPLVKAGLKNLVDQMKPQDRLAIVTYGGSSQVLLSSTLGLDRDYILQKISQLDPGIRVDAMSGIDEAYRIAFDAFIENGDNQVIVCTDGDLLLGTTDPVQLSRFIDDQAERGVALSAYGFSIDPDRRVEMEALAAQGRGKFGYVDSPLDVFRAFSGKVSGEFSTIASDVKLEVEFNPRKVDAYRLIGFEENSITRKEVAGGWPVEVEVPAGHSVTALYELILNELSVDPKSDGAEIAAQVLDHGEPVVEELVTVRVHYQPEGRTQEELIEVLFSEDTSSFADASNDMRFAAAVTGFGQILRNSPYKGDVDFNWVLSTAGNAIGSDAGGYRTQFLEMVRQAESITNTDYSAAEN